MPSVTPSLQHWVRPGEASMARAAAAVIAAELASALSTAQAAEHAGRLAGGRRRLRLTRMSEAHSIA
jgi:hypothetical protein